MTGPDYLENLALACEAKGVSIYLLAEKPGVVNKAIQKIKKIAPGLNINGHHCFFNKYGSKNDRVIQEIDRFKRDILFVGSGMPVQECWVVDNIDRIDTRVFLPLRTCIDFYTETIYRRPRWMTDRGMEWLARFFTEPKRLWERYTIGNPLFLYRVLK
jgi:N-acetylglucosaminyldiphosphoundecaprenol N-acetyl-beta-D-mannosaminyltransferase